MARARKGVPSYMVTAMNMDSIRKIGLYCNRWIREDVILQLLQKHTNLSLTKTTLRKAYSYAPLQCVDMLKSSNSYGVFRRELRIKTQPKLYYFYFTRSFASIPPIQVKWENKAINSVSFFTKRRRSPRTYQETESSSKIDSIPTHSDDIITCTRQGPAKRKKEGSCEITSVNDPNSKAKKILSQSKWDSPEAALLFVYGNKATQQEMEKREEKSNRTNNPPAKLDVRKHIIAQIPILRKAYLTAEGWKIIVEDHDEDNVCTPYEIFCLQKKAKYLAITLMHALKLYETTTNFLDICTAAINTVEEMDYDGYEVLSDCEDECDVQMKIKNPKTIMHWLRTYRRKCCFPNPASARVKYWKNKLPPIFSNNPDLYNSFKDYARANLNKLSGELLLEYMYQTALPEVVQEIRRQKKLSEGEYTVKMFLQEHNVPELSKRTIYNWLSKMGFSYSPHKKGYYVDSHEKAENVQYRMQFVKRYEAYELRTHRWVQIPMQRYTELVEKGELSIEQGYKYNKKNTNEAYVELHVDDHLLFHEECSMLPFGGNLSVRRNSDEKPLILFGQDECIFKQYNLSSKSWTNPDGVRALRPKDEGQGVMVSSFISREFGFGLKLNASQLDRINRYRSRTQQAHYKDEKAAVTKNGTTKKQKLTVSPFSRELEYGANNEGYWTYESMVLQLEDCVDCVKALFPQYDYLFLFDHSNGHDRTKPDGLSTMRIRKLFGGKQPLMRDSKLTSKCFGPYHSTDYELQPNSIQKMVFSDSDVGPFYMGDKERESNKLDIRTGKKRKKYIIKEEMKKNLKAMGILNPTGSLTQIRAQCTALNLPTVYEYEVIKEGWVGKAKGALQVLYERGWIEKTRWKTYTTNGRKNAMGLLDEASSIKLLMEKQPDFCQELTLLQYYAEQMGVKVDRSPKCHPEIAGEGIEYIWALAKLYYRMQSIERKRSKENFRKLVQECLSQVTLTKKSVRMSSRRAREYMLFYKALNDFQSEKKHNNPNNEKNLPHCKQSFSFNHSLIEKTIKTYKSHRNAQRIR
jgi:hypothetical protein